MMKVARSQESSAKAEIRRLEQAERQVALRDGVKGARTTQCIQKVTLDIFDKMVSSKVIPLTDKLSIVRTVHYFERPAPVRICFNQNEPITPWEEQQTWSRYILQKIWDMSYGHIIHVDLNNTFQDEPRYRHRRNQMLPVMVFGVTAFGMVLVPIGFQFLAVLGGKALLLAKMALLLASINGLKRVATGGVHYGLYQIPDHYNYGYYDRGDRITHPRVFEHEY